VETSAPPSRCFRLILRLLALLFAGCATAPTPSAPAPAAARTFARPVSVGVLPLAEPDDRGTTAGLGLALQESMTWTVKREPSLLGLELEDLVQRSRQPSTALPALAATDPAGLARRLGVGVLVSGSIGGDAQRVTVELVVADGRDGATARRVIAAAPAEASVRADQALIELLAARGVTVAPPEPRAAVALDALRSRARGVAAMADAAAGGGLPSLRSAVVLLEAATRETPASGEAWFRLGEALLRSADYARARAALDRALALARQAHDAGLELAALAQAGEVSIRAGRYADAEQRDTAALALARARGDRDTAAFALHGLSIAYFNVHGDHAQALATCEEARDLWRSAGNPRGEAKALVFCGSLKMARGDFEPSRADLTRAVEVARTVHDARQELTALNDLGEIAYRRGEYVEAKTLMESALALARAAGDRQRESFILANLGRTLLDTGHYAAALPYARDALELARAIEANQYVQLALVTLGAHAFAQDDFAGAQRWWEEAIVAARATGSLSLEARSLYALAEVERRVGDADAARGHYEASLAITRRLRLERDESLALVGLARLAAARGDAAAAEPLFGQALAIASARGVAEVRWQAHEGIGALREAAGRDEDAARAYREAVDVIGTLAGRFGGADRQAFLASRLAVYDALARVLLRLHQGNPGAGHDRDAWAVVEAKKGALVAEVLARSRPQPRDAEGREQAARIQVSEERTTALEAALRRETERPAGKRPERVQELTTLLARTKAEYQREVEVFLAKYPQYVARFREQATIDPTELSRLARRLPADTLVVQYFAAPDRLYLFVVAREHFEVKTHQVAQPDLQRLVREYRQFLLGAADELLPWDDDGSPAWRQKVQPLRAITASLAEHLLGPIRAELARYPNVVLVPNDVLLYLPFHALTLPGAGGAPRFLAESHVVSYVTRRELVDLVAAPGPRGADPPLLAVANPDGTLKSASAEVRTLTRLRRAVTTLEGPEATKERFISRASEHADLHLATHGVFDLRRPELSYLVMAGASEASQQLTVREIAGLSLEEGGLVTLSACETALGEQVPGAALITLAAAFSQAGAQSIVASLWRVVDQFTRVEMETFYRNVPAAGRAAALTTAERRLLQDPTTRHPYYWAGFILIGGR
jgi:CHAT domain-containing protein/Tfp pilus assembly protein PilF